jgi:hypothetical protein
MMIVRSSTVGKHFRPLGWFIILSLTSFHRCHGDGAAWEHGNSNSLNLTVTPTGIFDQNGNLYPPKDAGSVSPGFGDANPFVYKEDWSNGIDGWVASTYNYNTVGGTYPDQLLPSENTPYSFSAQMVVLHNVGSCENGETDDGVTTILTKTIFLEAGTYVLEADLSMESHEYRFCDGFTTAGGGSAVLVNGWPPQPSSGAHSEVDINTMTCQPTSVSQRLSGTFEVAVGENIDIGIGTYSEACGETTASFDNVLVREIIFPSEAPSSMPSTSAPPSSKPSVLKKRKTPVKECLGEAMLHAKCGCKATAGPRCFNQVNKKHCLKDFKTKHPHSTRKQQGDFQQKNQRAYDNECKAQKAQGLLGVSAACLTC